MISEDRFFNKLLEALLSVIGRKSNVETVGSIANWANLLLEGRGEKLELSAKAVGAILRRLDFRTEQVGSSGRGVWLTQDVVKTAYNLARHYGAVRLQAERSTSNQGTHSTNAKKKPTRTELKNDSKETRKHTAGNK